MHMCYYCLTSNPALRGTLIATLIPVEAPQGLDRCRRLPEMMALVSMIALGCGGRRGGLPRGCIHGGNPPNRPAADQNRDAHSRTDMSLGSRAERRRWGPGAASLAVFAACAIQGAVGFVGPVRGPWGTHASLTRSQGFRWAASPSVQSAGAAKESQGVAESFVQTELRKAAMKLHTRDQVRPCFGNRLMC
jgi:hypothetical protein